MLAAGIILAIMIADDCSHFTRGPHAVPDIQREAALAIGGTRWR